MNLLYPPPPIFNNFRCPWNEVVYLKLEAHLSDCRAAGMDFVPLGGLSEDAIFNVRVIGKAISKRASPDSPSASTRHIFHRLATCISLWRGNARLWLHRHSTLPPLVDGIIWLLVDHLFPFPLIILIYLFHTLLL